MDTPLLPTSTPIRIFTLFLRQSSSFAHQPSATAASAETFRAPHTTAQRQPASGAGSAVTTTVWTRHPHNSVELSSSASTD
jgi:hypothetical protein